MVDDLKAGNSWTLVSSAEKYEYLQNIQIYIGNDPDDYLQNTICSGGPFLDINDSANW